eukprot:g2666.t1
MTSVDKLPLGAEEDDAAAAATQEKRARGTDIYNLAALSDDYGKLRMLTERALRKTFALSLVPTGKRSMPPTGTNVGISSVPSSIWRDDDPSRQLRVHRDYVLRTYSLLPETRMPAPLAESIECVVHKCRQVYKERVVLGCSDTRLCELLGEAQELCAAVIDLVNKANQTFSALASVGRGGHVLPSQTPTPSIESVG